MEDTTQQQRAIILSLLSDEPVPDHDPDAMARLEAEGVIVDGKPSSCARHMDRLDLIGV